MEDPTQSYLTKDSSYGSQRNSLLMNKRNGMNYFHF